MATGIPRKKKGETRTAYHDRLADLAAGAEEAGDVELSEALQRKAGKMASDYPQIRKAHARRTKRSGPGSYPWYVCIDDQLERGHDQKVASEICGRIRANSRAKYPAYWAAREGKKASNPVALLAPAVTLGMHAAGAAATQAMAGLLSNPGSDDVPFCGLGLDGGPGTPGARDNVVVVDRSGKVLDMWEIHNPGDLGRFNAAYPDLPVFGPLRVLSSNVRDLRRSRGAPVVEMRTRRTH